MSDTPGPCCGGGGEPPLVHPVKRCDGGGSCGCCSCHHHGVIIFCRLTDLIGAPMASTLASFAGLKLEEGYQTQRGLMFPDATVAEAIAGTVAREFDLELDRWGQPAAHVGAYWQPYVDLQGQGLGDTEIRTVGAAMGSMRLYLLRRIELIAYGVAGEDIGREIDDERTTAARRRMTARARYEIDNIECKYNEKTRRKEWYVNDRPTGLPCFE